MYETLSLIISKTMSNDPQWQIMEYRDLSAHKRDVLTACAVLTAESDEMMTAGDIRTKTGEIRNESGSEYTYTVIDQLEDDGWLNSTPDEWDERLTRYTLSDRAKAIIRQRGFEMIRCDDKLKEPEKPARRTNSSKNTHKEGKTPPHTLAAKVEETSPDAV